MSPPPASFEEAKARADDLQGGDVEPGEIYLLALFTSAKNLAAGDFLLA